LLARFESVEVNLPVQSISKDFSNFIVGVAFRFKDLCEIVLSGQLRKSLGVLFGNIKL
jgi:hypothetical protein